MFVIRCGTPDCEWGKKRADLSAEQINLCYWEFRKHCIQTHGLEEWNTMAQMHLNLEEWTLTLIAE